MYYYNTVKKESVGGNPTFSGIHFGLAKFEPEKNSITQVTGCQMCREFLMALLYADIGNVTLESGYLGIIDKKFNPKQEGLTPDNILLICRSIYYPKTAYNGITKLKHIPNMAFSYKDVPHNTDFVLSFPALYFKIPILISYITLFIRVASYCKGNTLKEIHHNASYLDNKEGALLAQIPYEFIVKLFKNKHKIDLKEQNEVLNKAFNSYSYHASCMGLGINGVVQKQSYAGMEYLAFLEKQLDK